MSSGAREPDFPAKCRDRSAVVAILGRGYVGLPLVLRFAEAGFRVIGIDIDAAKVERLQKGESYIRHVPPAAVAAARARGFRATADFSAARGADALLICVPTPLNK